MKIDLTKYKNILILTGAGVSVASGIQPFRGKNGLWNDPETVRFSELETLKTDPLAVWKFWMATRQICLSCQPNPAHTALVEIEGHLRPEQNFILASQNIDGLHQKSGSKLVKELHGNVFWNRCSNDSCSLKPYEDVNLHDSLITCPLCGDVIRLDIVFFGEQLPGGVMWEVKKLLRECDLFIAIGTSGVVSPAADFVRGADYAGARTIYINPDPLIPANPYFHEEILGNAEDILPELFSF